MAIIDRVSEHVLTDAVAAKLGVTAECRTHLERLPNVGGWGVVGRGWGSPSDPEMSEARDGKLAASVPSPIPHPPSPFLWKGQSLAHVEADHSYGDLICECELITRDRVIQAITEGGAANLDDIRRDTRLGMGPCQGGFCTYRAVALWDEVRGTSQSAALLRQFLQERWKGLTAIAWGDQLRQARLDEIIYVDTLAVDLLPQTALEQANGERLVTQHPAIATEYHVE